MAKSDKSTKSSRKAPSKQPEPKEAEMRRSAARAIHATARHLAAAEAASAKATATKLKLNLSSPYQSFFKNAEVDLVQIPGVIGEYGVTVGHTPIVSQLKPGVIKVHVERDKDVRSFFTAGGFALTHENSTTDIACAELVRVEDLDPAAVEAGLNKYTAEVANAADGSVEQAEAKIGLEMHQAMMAATRSAAA